MMYENLSKAELIKQFQELKGRIESLEEENTGLVNELERIRKSEHRYRMIFDHSYISIWEEDYSEVHQALENLKKNGIEDIRSYLTEHADVLNAIVRKLKVVDINPATVKLYNAGSKEELLGSLDHIFVPEAAPSFIGEMMAIADGARHYEGETVGRKITGERMDLLLRITIPESGEASDYSNVLIGIIDITERKQREQEYLSMLQLADSLRATTLALTSTMDRNRILDIILDESQKAVPYTAVTIGLLEDNFVRVVRHRGIEPFFTTIGQIQYIYNHPDTRSVRLLKESNQPVLIGDTRNSPTWIQFEATTWVRSYLAMPIKVRNTTIGLVSFYGKDPGMFSEKTIRTIEPFVFSAGVALENARLFTEVQKELMERKEAEERIRRSLKEKEILLMEIHHRVKNNLNIVASLLNLQADQIETVEQARNALQISQSRVHSMSLVHENLYQSDDLSHIDFDVYIRKIGRELVNLYTTKARIELNIEVQNIFLTVNQAVPLGMLLIRHSGGVHIRHTPYRKELHDLIFFADNGLDIATSKAKALER
ncbi:MAG: histidine kinase dimerization/phosphoacceptor domain -containing protein, partial [Spirochaetota bacterium]|nr:histidine kinase dimerization/phosphoacceptor domain -containing protein [Spirochaetota bacterium]